MENAAKALLIAAGVLIAILVLSLLVVAYTQMSDYYQQQHEAVIIEQTKEFNSQFENYNRKQIRGSDIISLMNRVIDYNSREAHEIGKNYLPILVEIKIGDAAIIEQFRYPDEDNNFGSASDFIPTEISNKTGTPSRENDKKLKIITTKEDELLERYKVLLPNISVGQLQSLASEIGNIIINEDGDTQWDILNREKRASKLSAIFKETIQIDPSNGKSTGRSKNIINAAKEIAYEYYQYTQFKRAYFDCIEVLYDEKTGRVCEMEFELRINSNGNVEFN